jgi:glucose/arabinose dehydrogenase
LKLLQPLPWRLFLHTPIQRLLSKGMGIIFASGLRNAISFEWKRQTGELWGLDHGIDLLGDEVQPEELNQLEQGKQYGWPHMYGKAGLYP